LVQTGEAAVLFDIGSGAAGKLRLAIDYARLDAIVISHMHADHFFDLVPLRYGLRYGEGARPDRLPLFLPPGGLQSLQALRAAVAVDAPSDFFESVFIVREYDPAEALRVSDLRLTFARTRHYVEGYAIRAESDGATITYSGDTAPCENVVEHARGSASFLCEAALGLRTEEGERGHSSAVEAGAMAQRAAVGQLILTHYPAADSTDALVAAAERCFSGPVAAATDGEEFHVPELRA
jgi:ribonuclease BN (tRNA processing enzyme)